MNILIESVGFTPSETLDQEIAAKLKRAFSLRTTYRRRFWHRKQYPLFCG